MSRGVCSWLHGSNDCLLTLNQIPASVLEEAYLEQARALYEAGIRVFYLEGCQDPLNARAALTAVTRLEERMGTSVQKVVTARVLDDGLTLFGASLNDYWTESGGFRDAVNLSYLLLIAG